jgi:uncharacterized membrane protein YdbT with pleckstrin-like domain
VSLTSEYIHSPQAAEDWKAEQVKRKEYQEWKAEDERKQKEEEARKQAKQAEQEAKAKKENEEREQSEHHQRKVWRCKVDPVFRVLKVPGVRSSDLNSRRLLSIFAFNFNLYRPAQVVWRVPRKGVLFFAPIISRVDCH